MNTGILPKQTLREDDKDTTTRTLSRETGSHCVHNDKCRINIRSGKQGAIPCPLKGKEKTFHNLAS